MLRDFKQKPAIALFVIVVLTGLFKIDGIMLCLMIFLVYTAICSYKRNETKHQRESIDYQKYDIVKSEMKDINITSEESKEPLEDEVPKVKEEIQEPITEIKEEIKTPDVPEEIEESTDVEKELYEDTSEENESPESGNSLIKNVVECLNNRHNNASMQELFKSIASNDLDTSSIDMSVLLQETIRKNVKSLW